MAVSLTTKVVRGILLDIEGTTTPISFVHEVLFAYARGHLRDFLEKHFASAEVLADLANLRAEHTADVTQNQEPPMLVSAPRDAEIASFVVYINWLMDRDRKSKGLKSLQGTIWKEGYLDGTLTARLFADVPPAFKRWRRAGMSINIFSSGSAMAQELLFAHTEAGDLAGFIDNYFDTTVGSKQDSKSFQRIAATLQLSPGEIIFISDVVAELDAARAAGMQTLLCVRPGNQPQSFAERHPSIQGFEKIIEAELLNRD